MAEAKVPIMGQTQKALETNVLIRWPFQLQEVANAIDDPHDLNTIVGQPIQREPVIDDECPCVDGDVWASRAELRMLSQALAACFDAVEHPISRIAVTACDVGPQSEQIFAREARELDLTHVSTVFGKPIWRGLLL